LPKQRAWNRVVLPRADLRTKPHRRLSGQAKPAFVTRPRNRSALSKTIRNPSKRASPPQRFLDYPRPAAFTRITKLRENAPGSYSDCKWERTSHYRAPEFVASVTLMNANLIACMTRIMVTDGDHWRKKHIISRCHTLKRVVRLLIHVKETGFKARQLEIS